MPIPIDMLERTLIPLVLTPATTITELLYLLAEQPQLRRCYAVVRVGPEAYDALALDDLNDAVAHYGAALLSMALGAVPGLLRPAVPVQQDSLGPAAAERAKATTPRRRLVVLDATGAVLGVMVSINLAVAQGTNALDLLATQHPRVLDGDQPTLPLAPAYLNTQFKGLGPNQPLTVGRMTSLIVWVGTPTAITFSQSSRLFTFNFADSGRPIAFTVHVDADPGAWEISVIQPALIVAPPGKTMQAAVFRVMARQPGRDKLRISVERADTGATVQHVWLPVIAALEGEAPMLAPAASQRVEASLPLDATDVERRRVEITIQPGAESFVAVVRADLPTQRVRETYRVPVSATEVQNAALRLRRELEKIVFYQVGDGLQAHFPFANPATLTVDAAVARQAAIPLADAAQQVWHLLFNAPRAPEGLKQLAADLRELPHGSSVQIVLDSQQFIIPWGLLYDKPGPITVATLDWSGFWGYRYILDVLPPGRFPAPAIADTPLFIQVLLNDDGNLHAFTVVQEQFVQSELRGVQAHVTWGNAAIRQALAEPSGEAALVYFYCHGGHESGAVSVAALASESALKFGGPQRMRLADLRRLPAARLLCRPLVFLNACEGATQDAFYYDGFMPYFIEELGARGFIGTEVKAPQLLAHDFALRFLRAFAQGQPVGPILWRLRQYYLDSHHTILAFNYSLYGLSDMHLALPSLPTT